MTYSKQQIADLIKSINNFLDESIVGGANVDDSYHYYDLRIKLMALDRLNVIAAKLEDMLG